MGYKLKIKGEKIIVPESSVHYQVARYLKIQYPKVLFHSDGAGELMTEPMRIRQAKVNIPEFRFPDLQILEPKNGLHGMFLELKKDGFKLQKNNGDWVNNHILEQAITLQKLRMKGYYAEFAIGFDEAKIKIDHYLKQK